MRGQRGDPESSSMNKGSQTGFNKDAWAWQVSAISHCFLRRSLTAKRMEDFMVKDELYFDVCYPGKPQQVRCLVVFSQFSSRDIIPAR